MRRGPAMPYSSSMGSSDVAAILSDMSAVKILWERWDYWVLEAVSRAVPFVDLLICRWLNHQHRRGALPGPWSPNPRLRPVLSGLRTPISTWQTRSHQRCGQVVPPSPPHSVGRGNGCADTSKRRTLCWSSESSNHSHIEWSRT
jgi:hypothetical protein